MKRTNLFFFIPLFIASIVFIYSCHKDTAQSGSGSSSTTTDVQVTASLQGRVLDENGVPVQGAAVTSGTAVTTTDVNGVFSFTNIQMSSRFGFVKVVKTGYFTGSRTILTHANAGNFVQVNLLPRVSKGGFASASGGTITVQGGNTVAFSGGSVVTASSNADYSGNVNVYATYLDPTDSTLGQHMPGALRGITTTNQETGLQSFGMMAVELQDDAGNALQIAPGKTATITLTIPASLQASAPATIPLWYFSDTTGKWMEQGTATKQGNTYVGQVGHFTFWNCDAPLGQVLLNVHLKDQNGNPLSYTYIRCIAPSLGGYGGGGYTDTTGFEQGFIPKGMDIVLQVLNSCGGVIYQQDLGTPLADMDLGSLTVNIAAGGMLNLTGTAVDCSNSPVANGYVSVLLEGLTYRAPITNGNFKLSISRCSGEKTELQILASDNATSQQGSVVTVSVTSGNQDLGQVSACGNSTVEFINITLGGSTAYNFTAPADSLEYYAQGTTFNEWATTRTGVTPNKRLSFYIQNVTGTGTYAIPIFDLGVDKADYINAGSDPVQMIISSYGPVNGFITGSMTGTVKDSVANVSYPMTGSFNIMRSN